MQTAPSHVTAPCRFQAEEFEEKFLQIWDWIADKYAKGGVLSMSQQDRSEAERKGACLAAVVWPVPTSLTHLLASQIAFATSSCAKLPTAHP